MTKREILETAIQKAIEGGWKESSGNTLRVDDDGKLFCFLDNATDGVRVYGYQFNVKELIFNHDFGKALWPNEWERRYKLAMMVNSDDPIKYLGENI